jgi:hypothetical protein
MMTRDEHLAWAKARAFEYLPANPTDAFTSMASDLKAHPELQDHSALTLGMMMLMAGHLDTAEKMRNFIRGFN